MPSVTFTDAMSATVGDATKKSMFDKVAHNTEWLREASNQDHDFDISTGTGDHKMRVGKPFHAQVVGTHGETATWSLGFWQSISHNWYLLVATGDYTSFNSTAATFYISLASAALVPPT